MNLNRGRLPSHRELPQEYQLRWRLDMRRLKGLYLWLNIAGLALLIAAGWLVYIWLAWLRPIGLVWMLGSMMASVSFWDWLGVVLGVSVLMLLLHEGLHGLFFWIYTRQPPRFGIGPGYFYACAPKWYIPKRQALVVMLAPAVGITLGGLLVMTVAPLGWLLPIYLLIVLNFSGAVGDLYVAIRSLRLPRESLYHDTGHIMEVYCLEQGDAIGEEGRNPEFSNPEEGQGS